SAGRDRDPSALGCRIGYHRLLVRDRRRPDTLTTAGTSMLDLSSRTIFGEEHAIFREQVRRFFARELTPNLDRWEEDGIVPREFWRKCGEAGLLCPTAPAEYGGAGLDFTYNAIVTEELSYSGSSASLPLQSDIIIDYIVLYGSEA